MTTDTQSAAAKLLRGKVDTFTEGSGTWSLTYTPHDAETPPPVMHPDVAEAIAGLLAIRASGYREGILDKHIDILADAIKAHA